MESISLTGGCATVTGAGTLPGDWMARPGPLPTCWPRRAVCCKSIFACGRRRFGKHRIYGARTPRATLPTRNERRSSSARSTPRLRKFMALIAREKSGDPAAYGIRTTWRLQQTGDFSSNGSNNIMGVRIDRATYRPGSTPAPGVVTRASRVTLFSHSSAKPWRIQLPSVRICAHLWPTIQFRAEFGKSTGTPRIGLSPV